jgi:serine/threonine protein kinase
MTGYSPFKETTALSTLLRQFKTRGTPNLPQSFPEWEPMLFKDLIPNASESLCELLEGLLEVNPSLRLTASKAFALIKI